MTGTTYKFQWRIPVAFIFPSNVSQWVVASIAFNVNRYLYKKAIIAEHLVLTYLYRCI